MKRSFVKKVSFLLVLTLALGMMLTGCGSPKTDAPKDVPETPAASGEAKKLETVKVGFIYIGSANDGGYSQVHDEGRVAMIEAIGADKVTTIVKENVKESQEVEKVMNDMIDEGCNIIFANSFGYMPFVEAVAKKNPEVKFMHFSGFALGENYGNYFGRMYQPRYLSGMAAGLTTKNNSIGYVAAHPTSEVIRGINAFTLGVKAINPEAVVKVMWTNTWYDPALEKQAAEALLDQGVDTIAQHQDTTAPGQAASERGLYSVGYNMDMSAANPEGYIVSPVWHLGALYTAQVQAVLDGTWKAESYWGSMADEVVGLSAFGPLVSEETKAKVTAAQEQILKGELDVFAGEIKDQNGEVKVEAGKSLSDQELLSMMWFVEGVEGEIPKQ